MSNTLAVATVTATLRNVLFAGLNAQAAGTNVTTRPPDRARANSTGNQVNLFLFQAGIDAAWRNADMPGKTRPGEVGRPPLPLILHYLITAYGDGDEDLAGHQAFGSALGILHDHPTLGRDELRTALLGADLHDQIERVHITPKILSIEELSKLWTTFQAPMRISAAYEACVVLIDSTIPSRAAPPVLARNAGDRGPSAAADTSEPFPRITTISTPEGQETAHVGDVLAIGGTKLGGTTAITATSRRLTGPIALAIVGTPADDKVQARLPANPAALPAGAYTLSVAGTIDGREVVSPEAPFGIAPRITAGLAPNVAPAADGSVTFELTVSPSIVADQTVALIVGSRMLTGEVLAPASVRFQMANAPTGPRPMPVRLRVDGVDSHVIDLTKVPPEFDPGQQVTIR